MESVVSSAGAHPQQQAGPPRAAYVHVPFCVHRCGYCDFTVVADRDDLITRYLSALETELAQLAEQLELTGPFPCDTIFIGGGTPTYLAPDDLERLLTTVCSTFRPTADCEWSIEANPFGFTDERLAVLERSGVNRVSLGVQSFNQDVLTTLERDHTPELARDAVTRSLTVISNTSLDLIFGVPGQSLGVWRETLDQAVALNVPHVSCYGLTVEKGTSFWSRRSRGTLTETDDDVQRSLYATAIEQLGATGLEQYELSNYSRPGFESRHNANYWSGGEFFGVGPGAASLVGGVRRTNHRSTTTWLKRLETGRTAVVDEEPFDARTRGSELIMTALRRRSGLTFDHFLMAVGIPLHDFAPCAIDRCVAAGWLAVNDERVWLTTEGRFVADSVIAEFFA